MGQEFVVVLSGARPLHALEDLVRCVLERKVDIFADLVALCHCRECPVVNRRRIEVKQADPFEAIDLVQFAQKRSERTSFALHRDAVVDVRQYAMLAWSWKVMKLPEAGDVRDPLRNDQAAQVYVVFPRWPAPQTASDVLGYVWDSQAPVGTTLSHRRYPNVRIVVVESGSAKLDSWQRYARNVAEDYQALFGRQPPRVGKVALMIDTNDTRGEAEALFGDLTFFRPGVASMEIPVTMLR